MQFDHIQKESQTYILGKNLAQKGYEDGHFVKLENGAIACEAKKVGMKGDIKKVIQRGDGTSVYITQDLGTAMQRFEMFHKPDKLVYIVADEQVSFPAPDDSSC